MITARPSIVDFGIMYDGVSVDIQTDKANLYITSMPSWIQQLTLPYEISLTSGHGKIDLAPREDAYGLHHSESIKIVDNVDAPTETFYLPVIWNYDSQKIPLDDIIDTFIISLTPDDYCHGIPRHIINIIARRGLQEMHYDHLQDIRYFEAKIDDVNKVGVPLDYLEYVRVFNVGDDGYLRPMYINKKINNARSYLKQPDGFLALDPNGYLISAAGLTPNLDDKKTEVFDPYKMDYFSDAGYSIGRLYGIAGGVASFHGEYKYDVHTRSFIFDNMPTKNVVIEYVSDPLLSERIARGTGTLRIHKYFQSALEKFIYYQIVEKKRSVPANEKQRAKNIYDIEIKKAKRRKSANKIGEIVQALKTNRGAVKWY